MAKAAAALHPCSACGFAVHEKGPGNGKECPVCGWVDDAVQLAQPDLAHGGNAGLSLRDAQRRAIGRFPLEILRHEGRTRDARWRPLADGEIPRSAAFSPSSPVCYLEDGSAADSDPYWLDPPPSRA